MPSIASTYFKNSIKAALRDPSSIPATLTRTKAIWSTVKQGEKRRNANLAKHQTCIPKFCIFSVTWRCNLECKGCYAKAYEHKQDLPPSEIQRVISEASDLGTYLWIIAGGEPLLVDNLIPTLAEIENSFFFLFTNATLLDDSHVQGLKKTSNILPIISVEGEMHCTDFRRGRDVSKKVEQAMSKLKKAHIPFGFSAMATHQILQTVTSRNWFDQMWDTGARFGFIIDYVPFARDLNPDFVLTPEDREQKARALKQRNSEGKPLVFNLPADEYKQGSCASAGRGFMHINADGFVEPCPFSHFAADNVRDKSILQILRSDFFQAIRTNFENTPNPTGECMLFSHQTEVKKIARQSGAKSTDSDRPDSPSSVVPLKKGTP